MSLPQPDHQGLDLVGAPRTRVFVPQQSGRCGGRSLARWHNGR